MIKIIIINKILSIFIFKIIWTSTINIYNISELWIKHTVLHQFVHVSWDFRWRTMLKQVRFKNVDLLTRNSFKNPT